MENTAYMTNGNTGVVNSTPVMETPSNDGYMEAQDTIQAVAEPQTPPVEVPEMVKPYTFRKLNSTDLFPMIKIISKIGIDELTQVFDGSLVKNLLKSSENSAADEAEKEGQSQFIVGVGIALKVANKILEHIPTCEQEIYNLLARVSGMGIEEVKNLDLNIFMEMILDFCMKDEFADFFKVASRYIRRLG